MLTDEEFEKLESQYNEERANRRKIKEMEGKIENCKEVLHTFTTDDPWTVIYDVTLTWMESTSDVEGRREISRENKILKISNPSIFAEGIKQMIKQYEDELKSLKGEKSEEKLGEANIDLTELMAGDKVEKELDKLIEEIIYLQTDYNLNLSNILQHASNIKAIYLGGKEKC